VVTNSIILSLCFITLMISEIEILKYLNEHRVVFLDDTFIFLSASAYAVCAAVLCVTGLFGFLKAKRRYISLFLLMGSALLISTISVALLKYGEHRERPFVEDEAIELLTTANSPSFPSGHTTTCMVIFVTLAFHLKKQRLFLSCVFLWAFLVGYSRLALGAHYPSDVLTGVSIAFLSVAIVKSYLFKYCSLKL